jgi:Flp pilus assembly protein CpaB
VTRDMREGDTFASDQLAMRPVSVSAMPRQALLWEERTRVVGLKTARAIPSGDYVLISDVRENRTMGSIVGPGEWAVTLGVSAGIAAVLQPGDEVAVITTAKVKNERPSLDGSTPSKQTQSEATMVLFPRVRVLDNGASSPGESARMVVVALPPSQAQVLIAAQRRMDLTVALRRPGDETALRREDAGIVSDETFLKLFENLEMVKVPSTMGGPEAHP